MDSSPDNDPTEELFGGSDDESPECRYLTVIIQLLEEMPEQEQNQLAMLLQNAKELLTTMALNKLKDAFQTISRLDLDQEPPETECKQMLVDLRSYYLYNGMRAQANKMLMMLAQAGMVATGPVVDSHAHQQDIATELPLVTKPSKKRKSIVTEPSSKKIINEKTHRKDSKKPSVVDKNVPRISVAQSPKGPIPEKVKPNHDHPPPAPRILAAKNPPAPLAAPKKAEIRNKQSTPPKEVPPLDNPPVPPILTGPDLAETTKKQYIPPKNKIKKHIPELPVYSTRNNHSRIPSPKLEPILPRRHPPLPPTTASHPFKVFGVYGQNQRRKDQGWVAINKCSMQAPNLFHEDLDLDQIARFPSMTPLKGRMSGVVALMGRLNYGLQAE
ncbi:hypothetical protein BDR26DRAFT_874752 [Obelidium mucronatum]|nr:hypothetical protein BDR26DRAFT_874752 [Obelidium mucronatum]